MLRVVVAMFLVTPPILISSLCLLLHQRRSSPMVLAIDTRTGRTPTAICISEGRVQIDQVTRQPTLPP
jgi:hypothetical protein